MHEGMKKFMREEDTGLKGGKGKGGGGAQEKGHICCLCSGLRAGNMTKSLFLAVTASNFLVNDLLVKNKQQ